MSTHLPIAVRLLVLALAMLSSGCLWLAPSVLLIGKGANPDVASWPEYTIMVDGTFLTFPFHPTADGKPLYTPGTTEFSVG